MIDYKNGWFIYDAYQCFILEWRVNGDSTLQIKYNKWFGGVSGRMRGVGKIEWKEIVTDENGQSVAIYDARSGIINVPGTEPPVKKSIYTLYHELYNNVTLDRLDQMYARVITIS